jgi:putative acetyltransferase
VILTRANPATDLDAIELMRRLSLELSARYDFEDDGRGDYSAIAAAASDRAVFLIGRVDGVSIACGAYRPLEPDVAEIKRMYVVPECRRRGYSRLMLRELERLAALDGYQFTRLETGERQPEAIRLYESCGYYRVPAYGHYAGHPHTACFERRLT